MIASLENFSSSPAKGIVLSCRVIAGERLSSDDGCREMVRVPLSPASLFCVIHAHRGGEGERKCPLPKLAPTPMEHSGQVTAGNGLRCQFPVDFPSGGNDCGITPESSAGEGLEVLAVGPRDSGNCRPGTGAASAVRCVRSDPPCGTASRFPEPSPRASCSTVLSRGETSAQPSAAGRCKAARAG